MATMLLRLCIALLAIAISAPAACLQPQQQSSEPDCCHKRCPKPVQLQPCFDCVADVPTTAATSQHYAHAIVPHLVTPAIASDFVTLNVAKPGDLTDKSGTYLRVRVLRI